MAFKKRIVSLLPVLTLLALLAGCYQIIPTEKNGTDKPQKDFTPTVFTEVVKYSFEESYADQLSPNEKRIYDEVTKLAPGETELSLTLPETPALCQDRDPTTEETDALSDRIRTWTANALYAVWLDCPEIFWLEHNAYSYAYELASDEDDIVKLSKLTISLKLVPDMEDIPALAEALAHATEDFSPPRNISDAQKAAYINNYLCRKIEYDLDAPQRGNIIGALVYGKCVCEGYAQAFSYLAKKADISAVCIPGYATSDGETQGHMWNAVNIDGALYAIDSTWNDTLARTEYLLVGKDSLCYGNVAFGESHTPNMLMLEGPHKTFALPDIASQKYETTIYK